MLGRATSRVDLLCHHSRLFDMDIGTNHDFLQYSQIARDAYGQFKSCLDSCAVKFDAK